jgi:hypothetical protein
VPVIVDRFYPILELLNRFALKSPISDLKKIRPVAAALKRARRRTDGHDEANRCFSLFMRTYLINGTSWLSVVPYSVLCIKNAPTGNVAMERMSLLLRIPELQASIVSPEMGYSDWDLRSFTQSLRDITSLEV